MYLRARLTDRRQQTWDLVSHRGTAPRHWQGLYVLMVRLTSHEFGKAPCPAAASASNYDTWYEFGVETFLDRIGFSSRHQAIHACKDEHRHAHLRACHTKNPFGLLSGDNHQQPVPLQQCTRGRTPPNVARKSPSTDQSWPPNAPRRPCQCIAFPFQRMSAVNSVLALRV